MHEKVSEKPQMEGELKSLLHNILSKVVLSDVYGLKGLKEGAYKLRLELDREAKAPSSPLEDPKIAYGYMMALGDALMMSELMIIPSETMAFLLHNPLAHRGLVLLSDQPTGIFNKTDFLKEISPEIDEATNTLNDLEKEALLKERNRGSAKRPFEVVQITPLGTATTQILGRFGLNSQEK